ncbi:MAG: hypothetical protein NXI20_14635 [bacterium]|nr:hypothetical protein [bacterium]
MKNHTELTDEQFLKAFSSCELLPSLFNHEAHIRLAWILITDNGLDRAKQEVVKLIGNYVKNLNQEDKFNLTLTIAATEIISNKVQHSSTRDFQGFIDEFPGLITEFKTSIYQHYSFDIFNSDVAKTQYLPPDLIPFD